MSLAHDLTEKERSEDVLTSEDVTFNSLLLSERILKGLDKNGFVKPSPIQLKAIPLGKCGFDLIIHSKSGTGKTLIYAIVALEMVDVTNKDCQVLIVTPTREIAVQVQSVIKAVGSEIKDLKVEVFIGGLPVEDDIPRAKNCHIAVGAPGRLQSLLRHRNLDVQHVRLFVLDEADKLIETNMQTDINFIHHYLQQRHQTLAMSATYESTLQKFLHLYMRSPTFIDITTSNPMLLGLKHFIYEVPSILSVVHQMLIKTDALITILDGVTFKQCVVFFNYQVRVENVHNSLQQKGWDTTYISGAQKQSDRLKAINSLKDFKCRVLLSTDLTARGIDAANVDLVINYDIPTDSATYLHRMGRAGRYGSRGLCINLATAKEIVGIQKILGEVGDITATVELLTAERYELNFKGKEMKIEKLPKEKLPEDFWSDPEEPFEIVDAIVDVNASQEKASKLVWDMKESSACASSSKGKKIDTTGITDEQTSPDEESSFTVIDQITEEMEVVKDEPSSQEENDICQETGMGAWTTIRVKNLEEPEDEDKDDGVARGILEKLAAEEEAIKKRKRPDSSTRASKDVSNAAETIAIGQVIVDTEFKCISEAMEKSVENVLEKIKANSDANKSQEDIISDDLSDLSIENKKTNANGENPVFNMLQLAYDKAAERTQLDWFEFVKDPVIKDRYKYGQLVDGLPIEYHPAYNNTKPKPKGNYHQSTNNTNQHNTIQIDKSDNTGAVPKTFGESSSSSNPDLLYVNPNLKQQSKVQKTGYQSLSTEISKTAERQQMNVANYVGESQNFAANNSQWCQAYNTENTISTLPNEQHYQSYFDYYGNCLAQSIDTFEDVPTFELWYDDWKKHLQAARDFVQRKIYIQEMNNQQM